MSEHLKGCMCHLCSKHHHFPAIVKAESSLAAPTGLAANVVVNQALVNEIVQRARDSQWGLGDPDTQPDIEKWSPANMDSLAHCLVSSWTAKYDLVSVFSAAMSVIQEKAANEKLKNAGPRTPDVRES
jgi:hypothetical protein